MKKIILITGVLFFSLNSYGSSIYAEGETRVQQALEAAYPGTSQDWVPMQSCSLCHTSNAGGPGQINGQFGADYSLNGGSGGSLSVAALQTLFAANGAIAAEDSDGDGFTNLEEFQAASNPQDPADNPTQSNPNTGNNTSTGGGSGGGCGLVDDSGQSSFVESSAVFGMFFLPLLFTFGFRRRSRKA